MAFPKDGVKRELKDGQIVEMGHLKFGHERVKSNTLAILVEWALRTDSGIVLSETEYLIAEHVSYMPDVSFLTKERAAAMDPDRFAQGAPDLAVEVVSSESAEYRRERSKTVSPTAAEAFGCSTPNNALSGCTTAAALHASYAIPIEWKIPSCFRASAHPSRNSSKV